MSEQFGEAITTARKARGWTQEQLAERVGIQQGPLSRYENDLRQPDEAVLDQIASALGVTARFLRNASQTRGGMAVDTHMRRRATAKASVWREIEARLNMYRIHARTVREQIALRAEREVPRFDPLETNPADAARLTRMHWHMPVGPVRQLVRWIEAAGCLVVREEFGTDRIDGMSQWVDDLPVMLINSEAPPDRLRLTIAHELGHLCLHSGEATETMEQDANEFAAELLMPAEVIRPQLRGVRTNQLPDLKVEWGVSMAALVERAHSLGVMTATQRTSFYKMMGARGWRKQEPKSDQIRPELPSLSTAIADAMVGSGLSEDEIAKLAGFANSEYNDLFVPSGRRRLKAV